MGSKTDLARAIEEMADKIAAKEMEIEAMKLALGHMQAAQPVRTPKLVTARPDGPALVEKGA